MPIKDRWSALSMKDKASLIKLMVENGVSSIDEMKRIYNSDIDRAVNATEHNFVQRLKDYPNTPKLDNGDGTFSTHSMASGEVDGKAIVYPTVQMDENGRLRRYSDDNFEAQDRAIRTNDTLQMHPAIAPWYAENYKQFYNIPNEYSKGGSIHIKPENRGKFNATKKRTGKTTEELTHSKNPLTRKRAIFAQNAKKWHHHPDGGPLDWSIPQQEYPDIILPYDYDWFKYNQTLNRQRYAESSLLNNKKSPKGAKGPYQIMDITYKDYLTRGKGKPVDVNTLEGGEIVRNHVLNFMPKDLGDTWSDDSPEEVNQAKLYVGYNMGGNALKKYLKKQAAKGIDIMNSLDWYDNLPYKEPKDYTDFIVFSKDVPDTSKTMQQYYEAWQKRGNGTFLENYPKKEEINWNLLQTLNK